GHPIPAVVSPRRAGDPAKLVATSEKAMIKLNRKKLCQANYIRRSDVQIF
ncbi:hypothetical protein H5986_09255, partial [Fusobacterium mortiferum]|nr:hypothetical protein [Fusobacterium mortiferum]